MNDQVNDPAVQVAEAAAEMYEVLGADAAATEDAQTAVVVSAPEAINESVNESVNEVEAEFTPIRNKAPFNINVGARERGIVSRNGKIYRK